MSHITCVSKLKAVFMIFGGNFIAWYLLGWYLGNEALVIFSLPTFLIPYLFFRRAVEESIEYKERLKKRRQELDKEFKYWYKIVEKEFKRDVEKLKIVHQIKKEFLREKSRSDIESMQLILDRIKALK